jgi:hypothetical protein
MTAVWILVAVAVIGVIAYNARMGAVSPRIANPDVTNSRAEATSPSMKCSGGRSE